MIDDDEMVASMVEEEEDDDVIIVDEIDIGRKEEEQLPGGVISNIYSYYQQLFPVNEGRSVR